MSEIWQHKDEKSRVEKREDVADASSRLAVNKCKAKWNYDENRKK